jgi:hypothetical protein
MWSSLLELTTIMKKFLGQWPRRHSSALDRWIFIVPRRQQTIICCNSVFVPSLVTHHDSRPEHVGVHWQPTVQVSSA